jgi:excinuclease ABC subunit A
LDVVACSDWVVDLGPEGGERGGELVAEGTPEELSRSAKSHTARYLRPVLASAILGPVRQPHKRPRAKSARSG